jgi:hypothetical protein
MAAGIEPAAPLKRQPPRTKRGLINAAIALVVYIYEGLLELDPKITEDGRTFTFAETGESRGHARKTTGSYYTPDELVQP